MEIMHQFTFMISIYLVTPQSYIELIIINYTEVSLILLFIFEERTKALPLQL